MTRSIAIVGAGPRGTGILERLVARGDALVDPIDVHVVDPYPTGAGRIWRREQDSLLWMNSVASDVAMLPDDADGPTLADWVLANRGSLLAEPDLRDEVSRFTATAFASRSLQSRYLTWVFESVIKSTPDRVRVHVHRATVTDVADLEVGQRVSLNDGTTLDVESVVLAQGHPDSLPSSRETELSRLAADHGLIYVGPGYTADLDPTVVPEAEPILVSGLGLAFVDWMVLLAESRGGVFHRAADGTLGYTASGREPVVYAGSRRGVPYHAKISYSIADAAPPLPRFFTAEALPGDGLVDFRADVWPLASKELAGAHYHELFRSHPERTRGSWADFDAVFSAEDWASPRVRELEAEFVPDPIDRIDLDAIDRPLAGQTFASLDDARARVHEYIDADLRRRRDPDFSSDAAVFTGLLSVYRTVGELVRTERLDSATVAAEVEGWLHSSRRPHRTPTSSAPAPTSKLACPCRPSRAVVTNCCALCTVAVRCVRSGRRTTVPPSSPSTAVHGCSTRRAPLIHGGTPSDRGSPATPGPPPSPARASTRGFFRHNDAIAADLLG